MSMKNTNIEAELKEAFSTYRTQYTLLTHLITIFVIANVTFIGFSLKNTEMSEIIMLGAVVPFLILITKVKSGQLILPILVLMK